MKNKKLSSITLITFITACRFVLEIANAQTLENPATPEIFNEPGAKLLITEVNLKNKEMDFVELYYESPAGKPLNIKNFQFQDDNVFKKITQDYWLYSKEYYLLQFKNTGADNQQTKIMATTRTGLTSTTEQIIFKDPNGKILDALCWANATPTADEIKDLQELFDAEGWVSANPASCFPSAKISTNQSLIRTGTGDTDSMNDWSVTDDITPGKSNVSNPPPQNSQNSTATQQLTETTSTTLAEQSATTDDDLSEEPLPPEEKDETESSPATSTAKSTTSKKTSTTSAKKTTSTAKKTSTKTPAAPQYKDGDISSDIIISEIYPRAKEDNRSNEWIELTNTGDLDINLGNWQVDDAEGSSKPYTVPDTITIPAQKSFIIKASDSKISLANTKDMVRLFDPEGTLLQTVEYEEAPKDESYALIIIDKEDGSTEEQWLWEKAYTPNEPNPQYQELSGTILNEAVFGETYHFTLQPSRQENTTQQNHPLPPELTVIFDESLIAGPLAKATFQKNAQIKILGIPNPENPQEFQLKQYEILASPGAAREESSPWVLLGLLPPGGAGFWFGLKKIRQIYGAHFVRTSS